MGAVDVSHAGIASGINNAASRSSGLIAIAVPGIVVLQAFNHGLDSRLAAIDLAPEAREFLDGERTKLAAAELPPGLNAQAATAIRRAIKESFVAGFRLAMLIASGLALISAGVAWAMIEGKPGGSEPGSPDMSHG